jgi:1,4-dihydroxy-2-naphthoyl-CoA hydrolase
MGSVIEPTAGGAPAGEVAVPGGPAAPGSPTLEATSFERASAFVVAAGLVLDEVAAARVVGHVDLGPQHHTPWGIVHGGVYTSAIESVASIGASTAVKDRGMVAVGLTNTTHFLRSVAAGRVEVEAVALNQGRTQQLWRVDVRDGIGRLIAHGEVRLQNLAATA